jgi:hypothetical protein
VRCVLHCLPVALTVPDVLNGVNGNGVVRVFPPFNDRGHYFVVKWSVLKQSKSFTLTVRTVGKCKCTLSFGA